MRKMNKYSYNLKNCNHDIFYILQENEDDGMELYKYIAICLDCGKVIHEDRWEHPLPAYYIKSVITLDNGQEIFIPYEQIKAEYEMLKEKYIKDDEISIDDKLKVYDELRTVYNQ